MRHLADLAEHFSQRFGGADYVLKHRVTIDLLSQREVFVACPLFSLDAIMDVSSRRIPPNRPSLVVKQRVVMDEKPPVVSIFAQDSFFVLKWHFHRNPFQPFASESPHTLRIKDSLPNILPPALSHPIPLASLHVV